MATLKKLLGEAGAGLDESLGFDTLYDVLVALLGQLDDLTDQYNQLLADFNDETAADHTTSTATVVTKDVTVE